MKKLFLVILLALFLSACESDGSGFGETQYVIAGDTVYYRMYSSGDECLDEGIVEIEYFNPELVPIFQFEDEYVYKISWYRTGSNCESNYYTKQNDEYITLYDAFLQDIYTVDDYLLTFDNTDFNYIASEGPDEVLPTAFTERLYISFRGHLIYDANRVKLAALDYCNVHTCSDNLELTKTELLDYFYDTPFDFSMYDIEEDTVIAIYHVTSELVEMERTVDIYLERPGTGEWEYPNGETFRHEMNSFDTIIDND